MIPDGEAFWHFDARLQGDGHGKMVEAQEQKPRRTGLEASTGHRHEQSGEVLTIKCP